jgi:hypothetical protein
MDDDISSAPDVTSEYFYEHSVDAPAIIVSSDSSDVISICATSTLDDDNDESQDESPKSRDQNEVTTEDVGTAILGDKGATSMPNSMDYLSALPRSFKMMNVCAENHRHSVHLQTTLQKIAADRKKAWASIDQSQRNFILQQVFEKQLHPFYTHRIETVESTVNQTKETNQDNVKQRRRPAEETKHSGKQGYEDSDSTSLADSCNSSSTQQRVTFSPRHQMAVSQEHREKITANKVGHSDAHELNTDERMPRSVRTDWRKNDAAGRTTLRTEDNNRNFQQAKLDTKKTKSSENAPAETPIKVTNAKNSLALCVAHFERTPNDEQRDNKLHTSTTGQNRQQQAVSSVSHTSRQAPQKRRDITELKKVSDSSMMFPTLTKLLTEPKEIDDDRREPPVVHLPPLIADTVHSNSTPDPETDQYTDLIDVLATSVCSHLNKLKLLRGNDQKKLPVSCRKMYMYRRELLQRTRRQLLLNSYR